MANLKETYYIGLYLNKAMKDKGISINGLSSSTGINKNLLRSYLINERMASVDTIKLISPVLDKDMCYFTNITSHQIDDLKTMLLISKMDGVNEKDLRYSYKIMSRLVNQCFNMGSLETKIKLNEALFKFIRDDICNLPWEDNKVSE